MRITPVEDLLPPADLDFRNFRCYPIPVGQLTRIPATSDANRFYRRDDAIARAEDVGSMPTQGFRPTSNNVKPPVNGKKAAKAGLGVTGGFVEGRDAGDYERPINRPTVVSDPVDPTAPRRGHGSGRRGRKHNRPTATQNRYYR